MADRDAEALVARWCRAGAVGAVLFAVYIGLVPFRFTRPPAELWQALAVRAEWTINSRANFIANAILYIPVGLLGAGAAIGQRTWWRALGRTAGLVGLAMASTVCVELLQALTPNRTPSLADVVAQAIGLVAGIVAWLVARRDVQRWTARHAVGQPVAALDAALWLYAGARSLAMLLPLNVTVSVSSLAEKFRRGGIVINPSGFLHRADVFQAATADLVLAAPLGVLAWRMANRLRWRNPMAAGVVAGAVVSCVLEAAQVLVRSRTADVGDALAASVGTAVGVVVASRLFESGRRADIDRSGMPWAVLSLVCACALYAVYNLSPFDFTRPDDVNARVSALLQVPFSSYYEGPEFDGLWGALFKFGLGLPVGACTAWAARHVLAQYPRAVMAAAAVGWLVWFSVVEAGQVFLPSRYPDVTDILLAMCGAGVGLWSVGRVIAAPRH